MMKIRLKVFGENISFSEAELIAIVEKHYSEVIQKEREGVWYRVDINSIPQKLFEEKRTDFHEEATRNTILEAFKEAEKNPEKYSAFETMIPPKTWEDKTVRELQEVALTFDGHMADWVETALEWAQRITNGESWEKLCTVADNTRYYRMIIWKNGCARTVGGATESSYKTPPTQISTIDNNLDTTHYLSVPLIARNY